MYINDIPVTAYGAQPIGTFRVSRAPIENDVFHGVNRSNIQLLSSRVGLKTIECHVAFFGTSYEEIQAKRSKLQAALMGKLNIASSKDDFQYFCTLTARDEGEKQSDTVAISKLTFTGIQHKPLTSVRGLSVICTSDHPKTDCRLTVTVTSAADSYTLGTVTFGAVQTGDVLVADGINGIITKNGTPVPASFIDLPYLVPNLNTFTCPDIPLIEYYPTYL